MWDRIKTIGSWQQNRIKEDFHATIYNSKNESLEWYVHVININNYNINNNNYNINNHNSNNNNYNINDNNINNYDINNNNNNNYNSNNINNYNNNNHNNNNPIWIVITTIKIIIFMLIR